MCVEVFISVAGYGVNMGVLFECPSEFGGDGAGGQGIGGDGVGHAFKVAFGIGKELDFLPVYANGLAVLVLGVEEIVFSVRGNIKDIVDIRVWAFGKLGETERVVQTLELELACLCDAQARQRLEEPEFDNVSRMGGAVVIGDINHVDVRGHCYLSACVGVLLPEISGVDAAIGARGAV